MAIFKLKEHRIISEALLLMNRDLLFTNKCWFGGGTAIVLKLDEYRRSLDIDFVCSDPDGYRELRSAAVELGTRGFFRKPVEALREFKVDQYGLRTAIELHGQPMRFEIIREARIQVYGRHDDELGVPTLLLTDMFAEKLLANADRCLDRAVAYRDAFDLGMLATSHGNIPPEALTKATAAYGRDIERKLLWVVGKLQDADELRNAAGILRMDAADAQKAVVALEAECLRLWPEAAREKARPDVL